MPDPLPARIDPAWAWSARERDTLGMREAAHLVRRAGFGATLEQLTNLARLGTAGAVEHLFRPVTDDGSDAAGFDAQMNRMAGAMTAGGDPHRLSAWWLYRMIRTPDQLAEKMTLFWHGHFATSAAKVTDPQVMLDQHDLLRTHALGRFEPLVRAISRDPAMLIWLDSTSNRRIHPNENYAREIMELFCLGPGAYTEDDIKQVARAFTGWELRGKRFAFNPYQHDEGDKNILGRRGNFDGDDAIRIILERPAASRFIAAKLVRYLVAEEPALDAAVIEPLAAQLRDNGFDVGPVVRRVLGSNIFYSPHAIARRVRSPVELALGLVRSLGISADATFLAAELERLGQGVFYPPNVKGWDGGRTWINSSTLIGRSNLVRSLLLEGAAKLEGRTLAERLDATDPASLVDRLTDLLLAVDPPAEARRRLIAIASDASADADRRIAQTIHAMSLLPEFHLA